MLKTALLKATLTLCLMIPFSIYAQSTLRVGVLLDIQNKEITPLFKQLESEIQAVVGNDASVTIRSQDIKVNAFDGDLAAQHYRDLLKSNVDVILAFGPVNNALITSQKRFPKPTILFGAVNSDLLEPTQGAQGSGIKNFTYIVTPISYREDIKSFQSIFPVRKVAVIGAYGALNDPAVGQSLKDTFNSLGVEYTLVSYESIEQLEQQLDDVDSVYLAEGFGLSSEELKEMADLFLRLDLPSFSSNRIEDVENGWLASTQSQADLQRLMRRLALSVEAVVTGRNLAALPVYLDLNQTLTINFNTATRLGIPIRYSQIANINFVGDFDDWIAEQAYTIDQAVDQALAQNLSLKSSEVDVVLAEQNLRQSRTSYLPNMTASASSQYVDPDLARLSSGQNPEQTLSGNLALNQTLYSEDASAAIGVQRNQLDAQRQDLNTARLDIILSTTRASFDLLRLRNALRSQAENLSITKRNLAVAEQNFEAGKSGKADIFRFRSELANNMQGLVTAINQFQQGIYALNTILRNPIDKQISIVTDNISGKLLTQEEFGYDYIKTVLDDPSKSQVFEQFLLVEARKNSPELKALEYRVKAAERDIKQYGWRRYIPTVSATAQYNNVFDRSGVGVPDSNLALDDNYNVGLVFSIPLFNGNQDNVSLKRAKAQYEQLKIGIAQQDQQIESQLRNAMLNVTTNISNIELSRVSEQATQQSLALIENSYAKGAVTVTEFIDAQNSFLQAQLASSNALFDFLDSVIQLERTLGDYFFFDSDTQRSQEIIRRFEEYRKTHQAKSYRSSNEKN